MRPLDFISRRFIGLQSTFGPRRSKIDYEFEDEDEDD